LYLCDVIATDVENVWLVNLKILPEFRPQQNRPGAQKKTWNVKCNKTITALHFVQYDVLWRTEKVILTATFGLGQYCFPVLHNTSYRNQ
jgi:hypothetical protein